jgi:hypothetical protein
MLRNLTPEGPCNCWLLQCQRRSQLLRQLLCHCDTIGLLCQRPCQLLLSLFSLPGWLLCQQAAMHSRNVLNCNLPYCACMAVLTIDTSHVPTTYPAVCCPSPAPCM